MSSALSSRRPSSTARTSPYALGGHALVQYGAGDAYDQLVPEQQKLFTKAQYVKCDVTDEVACKAAIDEAVLWFKGHANDPKDKDARAAREAELR